MAFDYQLDGAKTADYIKRHHFDWLTTHLQESENGKVLETDFLLMTILCADYPKYTVGDDCKDYEDFMDRVVDLSNACDLSFERGTDYDNYLCCDGVVPIVRSMKTGEDWVGRIAVEELADVLDFAKCY